MSIQIHGDAAFPGQGIVTETLNLGELKGYQTGGTIHVIANNMVGFTTDSHDSRSTRYASNVAKGFEIPIVHVNADDPKACLAAVSLAYQYRKQFKKSFVIDLVGYRRYGHNEMDDPAVTQPKMYKRIVKHPTVKTIYSDYLQRIELLGKKDVDKINHDVQQTLQNEFEKVSQMNRSDTVDEIQIPEVVANGIPYIETGVSMETLVELNRQLLTWPDGFQVYPKLKRILERRGKDINEKIEWALAETLAFATILKDGTPIRLSGIVIELKNGLQARSAKEFVQRASSFNSEVNIVKNGRTVNGKSIMGVMATAIRSGEKLMLITDGHDEQEAIQSLSGFLSRTN